MKLARLAQAACCIGMSCAAMAQAHDEPIHKTRQGATTLVVTQGGTILDAAQQDALLQLPAVELRRRLDGVLIAHPGDVAAHFLRARAELELGDAAAALDDLEPVVSASATTGNSVVFSLRCETLIQLRRPAEALADGERAVAADDNDPDAHLARGWARFMSGRDTAAALPDLDRAIAFEPDSGIALSRHARVLGSLGELERAVAELKRATELEPRDADFRVSLGDFLTQLGRPEQALSELDIAVRLQPALAAAWLSRSTANAALGRMDSVVEDASRALQEATESDERASAYLNRAQGWAAKGDRDKMNTDLDNGLALAPTRPEFFSVRAEDALKHGEWQLVKTSLDRALALDPSAAVALAERAIAEAQLGDRAAALADGASAVRLAPDAPITHVLFGQALEKFDDHAAAVSEFNATIRLAPDAEVAWLGRGHSQQALANHTAAIADYTHVIEHSGTSARGEALYGRGQSLYAMGELARAASDLRAAVAALPEQAAVWRMLGRVLEETDDLAGSVQAYTRSIALEDKTSTSTDLARVLLVSGRFADAVPPLRAHLHDGSASPYMKLWIYMARLRADARDELAARAELASAGPPQSPRLWVDELTDFMLGHGDAQALQRLAGEGDPAGRIGRRCEADYYVAEISLAHGDRANALPLLAEAREICPPTFFEAMAAQAESRLQSAAR